MLTHQGVRFVLGEEWDHEYYQLLKVRLREHNRRRALAMEPPEAIPLNLWVEDEAGQILGGIAAVTYWGWLVIKLFVLDTVLRGSGVGQQLIQRAHEEARRRGCLHAQTTTYDFQALTFYQKQGYQIVGRLADYPAGYTYYWLHKDLQEETYV